MDTTLLKRLETFVAVAECLSFSEAGRRLFLSQPFVSRQIKELETVLGLPLFNRSGRKISLTEAGLCLLEDATKVKEQVEQIERRMRMLASGEAGLLRLATANAVWDYMLPSHMASFKRKFPSTILSLVRVEEHQVSQLLLDNRIHLGFVSHAPSGKGLEAIPLLEDEFIVIARSDHPLVDGRKHPPADLNDAPFVLKAGPVRKGYTSQWFLQSLGIVPRAMVEVDSAEAIKAAVRAGLGLAVTSRYIADEELASRALAEVHVDGPRYTRPLFVVRNRAYATSAQKAFMSHIAGPGGVAARSA